MGVTSKHAYRFVYLKSEKWQNVRLEALVEAEGKCRICEEESISNDAHHIYYPESFWNTTTEHLVILCRPCHNVVHALIKSGKRTKAEAISEWVAIIEALKMWRLEKSQWIVDPDAIVKSGPKDLRKAYELMRREYIELQSKTPKPPRPLFDIQEVLSKTCVVISDPDCPKLESSPRRCICCKHERDDVHAPNIFEQYGRYHVVPNWRFCKPCWKTIFERMTWPEEPKQSFRIFRKKMASLSKELAHFRPMELNYSI